MSGCAAVKLKCKFKMSGKPVERIFLFKINGLKPTKRTPVQGNKGNENMKKVNDKVKHKIHDGMNGRHMLLTKLHVI